MSVNVFARLDSLVGKAPAYYVEYYIREAQKCQACGHMTGKNLYCSYWWNDDVAEAQHELSRWRNHSYCQAHKNVLKPEPIEKCADGR